MELTPKAELKRKLEVVNTLIDLLDRAPEPEDVVEDIYNIFKKPASYEKPKFFDPKLYNKKMEYTRIFQSLYKQHAILEKGLADHERLERDAKHESWTKSLERINRLKNEIQIGDVIKVKTSSKNKYRKVIEKEENGVVGVHLHVNKEMDKDSFKVSYSITRGNYITEHKYNNIIEIVPEFKQEVINI